MSEIINEDVEFNSYLVGNGYGEWLLSQEDDEASWRKTMQQAIDEEDYDQTNPIDITSTITSQQVVEKYIDILQKRNDEQNKLRDALADLESLKTDLNTDHIKEVTFDIANSLGSIRMGLFGRDKVTGDITKLARVLHDNLPGDSEEEKQKYLSEIFPEISKEGNNIMAFYKAERGIIGATANYIREHGFKTEMKKIFYDVTNGPKKKYYELNLRYQGKLAEMYSKEFVKASERLYAAEERRRHIRALFTPGYKFKELTDEDRAKIVLANAKTSKLIAGYESTTKNILNIKNTIAGMHQEWLNREAKSTQEYRQKNNLDHFYDTMARDSIVQQIDDKEKEIESIRSEIDKLEEQRGNLTDLIVYLDNYTVNDVPLLSDEEFDKACKELVRQKEIAEMYTEFEPIDDEAYTAGDEYSDADIVSETESFGGNSLEQKLEENKQKIEALKKANKEIQKEINKNEQNKNRQGEDKSSKEKKAKKTKNEER